MDRRRLLQTETLRLLRQSCPTSDHHHHNHDNHHNPKTETKAYELSPQLDILWLHRVLLQGIWKRELVKRGNSMLHRWSTSDFHSLQRRGSLCCRYTPVPYALLIPLWHFRFGTLQSQWSLQWMERCLDWPLHGWQQSLLAMDRRHSLRFSAMVPKSTWLPWDWKLWDDLFILHLWGQIRTLQ